MFKCRRVRGLIAESIYGDLSEKDRSVLDLHLGRCAKCRKESEAMAGMVKALPDSVAELDYDLLPAIRARLMSGEGLTRSHGGLRLALAACIVMLVGALALYGANDAPVPADEGRKVEALSSMERTIANARQRIELGDYTGAYKSLQTVVEENPNDLAAGQAQMLLAGLAFEHLENFAEAHANYETLARNYFDIYSADPLSKERFNILAEAAPVNFASLYELQAATRAGMDEFEQLAKVVQRYPATYVASRGTREMARSIMESEDLPATVAGHIQGLETARGRCGNQIVTAQLDMELGKLYWEQLKDPDTACDLLNGVIETGDKQLAQLALNYMGRIERQAELKSATTSP